MSDQPRQDPAGRSQEQLSEAELETDVMDADLEEPDDSVPVVEPEPAESTLSEEELAEAELESDVMDADVEGP